jgi:hypothetical protein
MKRIITLFISVLFATIIGCEKDNINNFSNLDDKGIYVKNGILVFKNNIALKETLTAISEMTPQQYNCWLQENNFISLQSIFNNIVKAEESLDEPYVNLSESELSKIAPPPVHSSLYYTYLDKGLIKKIIYEADQTEGYELSTSFPALATILSPEGFYAVGDTIVYCGNEILKYWIHGDINKLNHLISAQYEKNKIEVWTLEDKSLKGTLNPNPAQSGWVTSGIRRLFINLSFESWQYLGDGTGWKYYHYINVRSEKKNFWGNWKYNETDMYIKGNWEGYIRYENPIYLNTLYYYFSAVFHPSYYPGYYHNFGNNLYCSISLFDGTISPYPTEWSVSYSVGGQKAFIYDISISHYNWEAIGHVDVHAFLSR